MNRAQRYWAKTKSHGPVRSRTHLLYGVELDVGAAVPDADEVIQAAADHAGGGADQGGDVAAVTVDVADPAARQDVPQADGPVLPPTGQDHGLKDSGRGAGHQSPAANGFCSNILTNRV